MHWDRSPNGPLEGPTQCWSVDFLTETLTHGRRFRVLAIVDDYTRECLSLVADTSLTGARVGRELDALARFRGKPLTIVSDTCGGPRTLSWVGTTSHQVSRPKMPLLRVLTAGYAMSC